MKNKVNILKILSLVLFVLLCVSVFKNISYPLLWADESMTAMGSERVVKFGYPKAHDGKNVVNDMFCNTPKVGVNPKDDAFIGGANWGQYYFGAIGYKLTEGSSDLYAKTAIYRSTFAIIGLLGLGIIVFVMSGFFENIFYKYLFISIFLLSELISISMTLHLKEVRYYSPTLFFCSLLISLYCWYRFRKPFHKIAYALSLAVLLWIVFNMFSPLYFIFILAIGISEAAIALLQYYKVNNLKESIMPCLPAVAGMFLSVIAVYPLLGYFETFNMKKVLDAFYHYNSTLYWWHFSSELRYFYRLELLWLAVAMRISVFINFKKVINEKSALFRVSNFISLLFVVFLFSIPAIDSPMFTRYLIYMQPVLTIIAIFDFMVLFKIVSRNFTNFKNAASMVHISIFILLFGYTFANNFSFIEGHLYEMTHQYKGPLDYTIPYIQTHYQRPDTLTIATDYEETSYMYYLHSKVTVGVVGNNLPEDTLFLPNIISYRRAWGNFYPSVFRGFILKAHWSEIAFPGKDIPVNNIPELNFDMPQYNHYFKSVLAENDKETTSLIFRDSLIASH